MQKLILLLLLIAPMGLFAQSDVEAKLAHQRAENLLLGRYPQAKKIDVELLTIQQKDQHKHCKTCSKEKANLSPSSSATISSKDLTHLKNNQKKLAATILDLKEASNKDLVLLAKYERAVELNNQQIRLAEQQLNIQHKKQLELKNKH